MLNKIIMIIIFAIIEQLYFLIETKWACKSVKMHVWKYSECISVTVQTENIILQN